MIESKTLRVLDHPDDLLRQERAARGARIDKLAVDRSRPLNSMLPRWSVEAQAAESKWEQYRSELTLMDRMNAYRVLFHKHCGPIQPAAWYRRLWRFFV